MPNLITPKLLWKNFATFLELKSKENDESMGELYSQTIKGILKRAKDTFLSSSEYFYDFNIK